MIKNKYFYFQSALSPENCQKIIDLGTSQIERSKQLGLSTTGTTSGNRHKQAYDESAIPLNDKTHQQVIEETGKENLKHTYVEIVKYLG
jgi:hypothetical protein